MTHIKLNSWVRIDRLDSIRFLAAGWVAISHGALPLKPLADGPILKFILNATTSSFNGVAAVVVFFIISGLCIHLPYSSSRELPIVPFLLRRYVRIGFPLLAISFLAQISGPASVAALKQVTWSVYAELFYYSLYPFVFWLVPRVGWKTLILIAAVFSLTISVQHLHGTHISSLGWEAWVWGLPVWLTGCLLADQIRKGKLPSLPGSLAVWRLSLWSLSVCAIYLVFHSPIKVGYQFSMLLFFPLAYGWLVKELQSHLPAWRILERCGAASYSLYLVHNVVLGGLSEHLSPMQPSLDLVVRSASVLLATFFFYRVVEAPSHRLARHLAGLVIRGQHETRYNNNHISLFFKARTNQQ